MIMQLFRNLINPAHVCQFRHFYAEYGGLNFMLAPNGRDSANIYLARMLERVYLGALRFQ